MSEFCVQGTPVPEKKLPETKQNVIQHQDSLVSIQIHLVGNLGTARDISICQARK